MTRLIPPPPDTPVIRAAAWEEHGPGQWHIQKESGSRRAICDQLVGWANGIEESTLQAIPPGKLCRKCWPFEKDNK